MMTVSGAGDRIKRAVAAGALGQAINMVGRLALVPLFLSVWGAELYGEWLIISALTAILAMSDFGGGIYFVNRLTELWQLGDNDKFLSMLSTGLAMFVVLPLCILLLLVSAGMILPLYDWMGLTIVDESTLLTVLVLLGIQICIAIPQGLLLGVYRATGAQATSVMLGNGLLLGQLGLMFIVLVNDGELVAMAASQLLPVSLLLVWIVSDLRTNCLKQPIFKLNSVSLILLREGFSPSMHFFAIRLAQTLVVQGSVLVIGRILGSAEVALFSTLRMLINLLMKILSLVSHAAWPEITKLASIGDKKRLQRLHILIFRASLFASVLYILIIEVAGEQLFRLWVGNRLIFDASVMRAFGWYVVITIAWTLSANLLMATNCHERLAKWQVFSGFSGIGLCAVGASHYGLTGAVVGLMIGEGLVMLAVVTSQVAYAPWGLASMRQLRELAIILFSTLLVGWPVLGLIAVCWLYWRFFIVYRPRTISHS